MSTPANAVPVKPIPEGYHSVTPYLVVQGAGKLIDFMKAAFDAQEIVRMSMPDGSIGHAEMRIGNSMIMIGEARDQWKAMPTSLYLYLEDVDAVYARAVSAGGTPFAEPKNQFYGDPQRRCPGHVRKLLVGGHAFRGCLRGGDEAPHGSRRRRALG